MQLELENSEVTVAVLKFSGWSEDRCVNTAEMEACIERAGHVVFPGLREFLSSFGGLVLSHDPGSLAGCQRRAAHGLPKSGPKITKNAPQSVPASVYEIANFDVTEARRYSGEDRHYYEAIIGEQVCPVGDIKGHMSLFASSKFVLYAIEQEYIIQLGVDLSTSLIALCDKRIPPRRKWWADE